MTASTLQEKAVLMRFSSGLPSQHRQDKSVTEEVRAQKQLGASGKWVKDLWPKDAMLAIKSKINQARAYHDRVTLPFGSRDEESDKTQAIAGIGILPAACILEYSEKMTQFRGELECLVEAFLCNPQLWIDWAVEEHNGTFEPANYPGCSGTLATGILLDSDVFRAKMRKKFYLRNEPLPVPNAEHFTAAVTALLGVEVESVNLRVQDAECEARRELVHRLIVPVRAMAEKLAEAPKEGKDSPIFRDSLISNLRDIVGLAPKLNISGDPQIDAFVAEVDKLTRWSPDTLRQGTQNRAEAAELAQATLQRLAGYKL